MNNGPTRMCAGCRAKRRQAELLRVVRRSDGSVGIDPSSRDAGSGAGRRPRAPGRGAYVCRRRACVRRALESGAFVRALGRGEPELRGELLALTEGHDEKGTDGEAEGPRGR